MAMVYDFEYARDILELVGGREAALTTEEIVIKMLREEVNGDLLKRERKSRASALAAAAGRIKQWIIMGMAGDIAFADNAAIIEALSFRRRPYVWSVLLGMEKGRSRCGNGV